MIKDALDRLFLELQGVKEVHLSYEAYIKFAQEVRDSYIRQYGAFVSTDHDHENILYRGVAICLHEKKELSGE